MSVLKFLTRANKLIFIRRNFSTNLFSSENIVRSPFTDVGVPNSSITEHVWRNMDRWANKTAIICGLTNHSYTYNQLYKLSRNFAANLRRRLNILEGDIVYVTSHNSPEYAVVVLGILEAGAVLTTCNPGFTEYETQKNLKLSNPKLIIGSSVTLPTIKRACTLAKKRIPIVIVNEEDLHEGTIPFEELIKDTDLNILKEVKREVDEVAILAYSSGTTGLSKGVELTSRNIVTNYLQQDVEEVKHYNDTTSSYQETIMAVLPFSHIYGLSMILLHKLSIGAKLISLPRFKPDTFLATLKEHKVSLLYAAPPMGSHTEVQKEHLASVNKIINGAAPVFKYDVEKMLDKTQPDTRFSQVYGSTEALLVTSTLPHLTDYTTSGYALSNTQLKIVDQDFKSLGANKVGELLIKGPQIMKSYRNNEDATKNSITPDSWLKSGDLAKINENGAVTIVDRLKEVIKVKGYQVTPVELENILREHPGVLDAGVIGVPDVKLGEAPKAFIVLKPGQNTDEKNIMNFVRQRVVDYKAIREVTFLEKLPKSTSGKLLRRVLKDEYC